MHKKPNWVKNVKATEQGWIDSDTGELLVVVRGLPLDEQQEVKPETIKQKRKYVRKTKNNE
jgi:hypothetical protein